MCNALAYAHSRGVLHRDLKPGNIVLGDYGEAIVLDWGLAKLKGAAESRPSLLPVSVTRVMPRDGTMQGQVLGTPAYMPPEQAEGRLDLVDERSDVYGLGAILYEILLGEPPFSGEETASLISKVIVERRFLLGEGADNIAGPGGHLPQGAGKEARGSLCFREGFGRRRAALDGRRTGQRMDGTTARSRRTLGPATPTAHGRRCRVAR